MINSQLYDSIFSISDKEAFIHQALRTFDFQYHHNKVYQQFCDYLGRNPKKVSSLEEIPFLPIEFFKTHKVYSDTHPAEITFSSSGTTGSQPSRHRVRDLELYKKSFRRGFAHHYGDIGEYVVLALLPSYLERQGSSLILMAEDMIQQSQASQSGFYLYNLEELAHTLTELDSLGKKVLLIGVSFALLDLVEQYSFRLENTIVMETGGMKGRRKELIREELHQILKKGLGVSHIHSEYGMTELLSQAYSKGGGIFNSVPWMRVQIRDTEDALSPLPNDRVGGINIIDLANWYSCSFIATQDLGKCYSDGSFEVMGRFDNSDVRGCNLMFNPS